MSAIEPTVAELAARLGVLEGLLRALADALEELLEELRDNVAGLQDDLFDDEITELLRKTRELLSGRAGERRR